MLKTAISISSPSAVLMEKLLDFPIDISELKHM